MGGLCAVSYTHLDVYKRQVLIHVVDISGSEGRDPIEDFEKINNELKMYSDKILNKPQLVAANKIDMIDEEDEKYIEFKKYVEEKGYRVFPVSAPINVGVHELMAAAAEELQKVAMNQMCIRDSYTVGDNPIRLKDMIELIFRDCDLIITTGGLGPTQDDLTKEIVCEAMELSLIHI